VLWFLFILVILIKSFEFANLKLLVVITESFFEITCGSKLFLFKNIALIVEVTEQPFEAFKSGLSRMKNLQ
jgi:hypothetical protein